MTTSIYQQPAAALDHGETPEGLTYVGESDVAAYVAEHAPDIDPQAVERALQSAGWAGWHTVADAIDSAIRRASASA